MLHKCANPACDARFRYLRQGRLFEVETHYRDGASDKRPRMPGNGSGMSSGSGFAIGALLPLFCDLSDTGGWYSNPGWESEKKR